MAEEPPEEETGTGEESQAELVISNYIAKVIHLFLAVLAVLLLVASAFATYDTVVRDFPTLWTTPQDEYVVLLRVIEHLLLIAIAVEFALLLLFRRMSAVVEVVVFVIARKTVNPENSSVELLLCAIGIAGLVVIQHYFIPGRTK
ncbi:MAG: hypothetical protein IPG58_09155 [Acidobacteria bacterium]|nr:hypothetical protein [Acidobacteriota bacterium]